MTFSILYVHDAFVSSKKTGWTHNEQLLLTVLTVLEILFYWTICTVAENLNWFFNIIFDVIIKNFY